MKRILQRFKRLPYFWWIAGSWALVPAWGALFGLSGCGRNSSPKQAARPPSASADRAVTNAPVLEVTRVSITNCISTAIGFRRTTQPPWKDGNHLTFRFRLPQSAGGIEHQASWNVANIHTENFGEITKRLGLTEVEVHVLHTGTARASIQEPGRPERPLDIDNGYAVVTDPRIPRKWFLPPPGQGGRFVGAPAEIGRQLREACPQAFRDTE